jgi:maleylacetate reductase
MSDTDSGLGRFTITLHGPRVLYGEGVAETELAAELDHLEARRVLVVASAREQKARTDLLAGIAHRIVGQVAEVRRHVPAALAREATRMALEVKADCLLSIGGGSAVGTAKAVALETGLPILAIPTTYAGSEVTPIYGITHGAVKRTGRSDRVLPRTVLLDPALSWNLPADITRFSAANALAHCVSGVFAQGRSPVTEVLAAEGARRIARGLRDFARIATSPESRAELSQGAYLAGTVLAHAGTSAHHAICHVLGGAFDLPHAETHTAVLPASSALLQERDPRAAARLAEALDAADLAVGISGLLRDADAKVRLRDIGLAQTDLPRAADLLSGRGPAAGVSGLDHARASQLLAEAW